MSDRKKIIALDDNHTPRNYKVFTENDVKIVKGVTYWEIDVTSHILVFITGELKAGCVFNNWDNFELIEDE